MCVLEIFDRCPADITSVSWRFVISVLEIFGRCPGDILVGVLEIFDLRPKDI